MPFAEWMPRLAVGVQAMDDQHQGLFRTINRMWDAYQEEDDEGLKAVLESLQDYAEFHFLAEEVLMEETAYEDEASHRARHAEFRAKVRELEWRREIAPHSVGLQLLEYLRDWLVLHIGVEDRKLGLFLAARGIR
jgi:hemerythrin-like metal-binding protein